MKLNSNRAGKSCGELFFQAGSYTLRRFSIRAEKLGRNGHGLLANTIGRVENITLSD